MADSGLTFFGGGSGGGDVSQAELDAETAARVAADEALSEAVESGSGLTVIDLGGNLGATETIATGGNSVHARGAILNANCAITTTEKPAGAARWIKISGVQDGTGGRTITVDGVAVSIPSAAGAGWEVIIDWDGTDSFIYFPGGSGLPGADGTAATNAHIADTSAAHAASAISFAPTGTLASTDVQAAIAEAASEAQPVDSDLTAIAALTTTSYGRAFLALADAPAGRTALGLGTAATSASTAFDAAGTAATAQAASQPVDSDLTAIAALTTTSYGRAFLALADASAGRTALGLGTAATSASSAFESADGDLTAIAGLSPSNDDIVQRKSGAWTNRTMAQLLTDLSSGISSAVMTLTNKRITQRVTTITSSATPAVNTDDTDCVTITALAAAITSMTSSLTGTPNNFDTLVYRIKDNGTARAITWGASFEAKGVALPTTTVISKVLTVGFVYDTVAVKWGCVSSAQEA